MLSELQAIVDALATRLDRAVAVDDRRLRIIAYSVHVGHVDEVRTASIMARQAPEEARRWVLSQKLEASPGPFRLPANPELAMEARVGAPVRCQGRDFGFVWLIDRDETLADDDLAVVAQAADEVGQVLYREELVANLASSHERELLRDLLSDEPNLREHAASELVERRLVVAAKRVAAIVACPAHENGEVVDESLRLGLEGALERVTRRIGRRERLSLMRPDHALLVLVNPAAGAADELAALLCSEAREALSDRDGWSLFVGIGDECATLDGVAEAYKQGLQAARVASIVGSFGPVISWPGLGVYRILSQLPLGDLGLDAVHPALGRLFTAKNSELLVETLERYLDLGCDAKAAADALALHRASLYYRIRKIEEITGADLRSGNDRLALHLGLKLARITGAHR